MRCARSPCAPPFPQPNPPTHTPRPSGVVSHWPACANWSDEYLCQLAGDTEVTVALTPNGRADAITPLPGSACALSGHSSQTTSPGSGSPSAAGAEDAAAGQAVNGSRGAASWQGAGEAAAAECFALPHQVKMPLVSSASLLRAASLQRAASLLRAASLGTQPARHTTYYPRAPAAWVWLLSTCLLPANRATRPRRGRSWWHHGGAAVRGRCHSSPCAVTRAAPRPCPAPAARLSGAAALVKGQARPGQRRRR